MNPEGIVFRKQKNKKIYCVIKGKHDVKSIFLSDEMVAKGICLGCVVRFNKGRERTFTRIEVRRVAKTEEDLPSLKAYLKEYEVLVALEKVKEEYI